VAFQLGQAANSDAEIDELAGAGHDRTLLRFPLTAAICELGPLIASVAIPAYACKRRGLLPFRDFAKARITDGLATKPRRRA
jgi:hypothetical protein